MPFAVLFRDIENIRRYVFSNGVEEKALLSWRRPIVLLKQLRLLASSVNPGMETLGCMLPYSRSIPIGLNGWIHPHW